MFNLLSQESFAYEGTKFEMKSLVIPLSLIELKGIIKNGGESTIKKRIESISTKTGRHILLLVEDIDSLIMESEDGENIA